MIDSALKKNILVLFKGPIKRPLSFKDIAYLMDVTKKDKDKLKKVLNELKTGGELRIRKGLYSFSGKVELTRGTFLAHRDGFGFVRPIGSKDRNDDIYINQRHTLNTLNNDIVDVRVTDYKSDGRKEGEIENIYERANKTIIGIFEKKNKHSIVIPSDNKITHEIFIVKESEKNIKNGTVVTVEITSWGTRTRSMQGIVKEIIGDSSHPDVETEIITRKHGLKTTFPGDVIDDAQKTPQTVSKEESFGRHDLRDLNTCTIDGETARDFDDAISIKKLKNGYKLYVSIADVSHYVTTGSSLDREAYARSTSVYFPDRCIPMLPERLSNGICSLNPNVDRLTLTAEITFDEEGHHKNHKFYESIIKSKERLTYNIVQAVIDGDKDFNEKYSHMRDDIFLMNTLSKKIRTLRRKNGSIDFDLPEAEIVYDKQGQIVDVTRGERFYSHMIIEDFMLEANKVVAKEFSKAELPFIYRIHEKPKADKTDELLEFLNSIGFLVKGLRTPKDFQKALHLADSTKYEHLVNHVMLRTMSQAKYSPDDLGHFGLAFDHYTHFTSPIRRYPDLLVHRMLKHIIKGDYKGKTQNHYKKYLPEAAAHTSERERKAMDAERDISDLKKCQFMADKVGNVYNGIISGVTSFGFFAELEEYFVEGLVHITTLTDDYYNFSKRDHSITGERTKKKFTLGDEVRVKIVRSDLERIKIDMVLDDDSMKKLKKPKKPSKIEAQKFRNQTKQKEKR